MAGTVRRNSMPQQAPMAKAASVHAANTTPRVANTVALSTFRSSCPMNGWKNQVNSWLNAPVTATITTPIRVSLAIVHRSRP